MSFVKRTFLCGFVMQIAKRCLRHLLFHNPPAGREGGEGRTVPVLCILLVVTACSLTGLHNKHLSRPQRGEFASLELGMRERDCEGRDVPDHKHLVGFTLLLLFHCFHIVMF